MSASDRSRTDDRRPSVLVVDNYDSFTYNLVEYLSAHAEPTVVTNTASIEAIRDAEPDAIVLSPGPGHPKNDRDVGVTRAVLTELSPRIPTFGVCLGLEAAVYEYGGRIGRAPEPVHGKASQIDHDGAGVFDGLEQGLLVGRYHSLVATEVPSCFDVTATTDHGDETLVMGVRHRTYPLSCVQFHPESVLTGRGHGIVENFVWSAESDASSRQPR
ncbi:anthranilate synthase component II [Halovivax cerinus]|uniref:anthranilate synthase n=1 Tax=Halovivax cerinus TaxID=1487865 RepID=A0ABD5NMH3_9EURY|nr:anthranilate synthase component II [Halovivax cerinus]